MEYTATRPGLQVHLLHAALPSVLGGAKSDFGVLFGGASGADGVRVIVLNDGLGITQNDLESVVDGHASLALDATKTSINADNVDETVITVDGLLSFDYAVRKYGVEIASGTAGDGYLAFSTDTDGDYVIEISNGVQTGYITITAVAI